MGDIVQIRLASTYASPSAGDVVCLVSDGGIRSVALATGSDLAAAGAAFGILAVNGTATKVGYVRVRGDAPPSLTGFAGGAAGRLAYVGGSGRPATSLSLGRTDYPIGTIDALGFLTIAPAPVPSALLLGVGGPKILSNAGSPEGAVAAPPGSYCADTTNGEGYIKHTGSGNTGWKLVTHA